MNSKMGRPKLENAKDIKLQVRVDKVTAERLRDYCNAHGTNISDVARKGFEIILNQDEKDA